MVTKMSKKHFYTGSIGNIEADFLELITNSDHVRYVGARTVENESYLSC